jgi:hypothetical protein
MAAKKKQAENFAFQIDVETDAQWRQLLRREGLIRKSAGGSGLIFFVFP